jgi:hypothetical protein
MATVSNTRRLTVFRTADPRKSWTAALPLRFLVLADHELAQPRPFAKRVSRPAKIPDGLIVGSCENMLTWLFITKRSCVTSRRPRRSFSQFGLQPQLISVRGELGVLLILHET